MAMKLIVFVHSAGMSSARSSFLYVLCCTPNGTSLRLQLRTWPCSAAATGLRPSNKSCSTEIIRNALSLKLLSSRSGSKWPAMISSGGVRTNHDTSCNACYHAMAPPVLRIQHGNCPLPMQFACDPALLPGVRRCTNVVTDKFSAPLDRHIDIDLSSSNIS